MRLPYQSGDSEQEQESEEMAQPFPIENAAEIERPMDRNSIIGWLFPEAIIGIVALIGGPLWFLRLISDGHWLIGPFFGLVWCSAIWLGISAWRTGAFFLGVASLWLLLCGATVTVWLVSTVLK